MNNFNFEQGLFMPTDSEDAYLRCMSFEELENNIMLKALMDNVQIVKDDTYIGHYKDHTVLSLILKNHDDPLKNEAVMMVIYENYALFLYDAVLSTIDTYIQNINYIFSQLADTTFPNLLIPYALIRCDLLTDRAFLISIENTILELEVSLTKQLENPQNTILNLRKTLSNYKHYYLSLIDLFEDMTEDYEDLQQKKEIGQSYRRLISKLNRLYKYSLMLSEYVSQVNEHYRAQMDLNLNTIMKTFTILSAIFLPLTLIVGWYGMNFQNIPELGSKYGYYYVIGLSLSILTVSLLYIKKRGFWD